MANVILVNMQEGEGYLEFPLVDDIQPQIENIYGSIGELTGGLSDLIGMFNTATTLISGKLTGGGMTAQNAMSFPMWRNTSPVKLNVRLLFYLGSENMETGKKLNDMMNRFIKRASISGNKKEGFSVPGLSASDIIRASENKAPKAHSKLVDVVIPRVLQLKNAYIASIAPTYSRQKTKAGYPIWGILEIQFSGLIMAIFEDNFENVPGYEAVVVSAYGKLNPTDYGL